MNQHNEQTGYNYGYDEIDLRDILRTLIKWKYTIISITLICMLISGIVSFFFLDPVYEASTVMVIIQTEMQKQSVGSIEEMVNKMGELPVVTPQSAVEQIKAPGILQGTIKKLDLEYNWRHLGNMIRTEQINDTNLVRIVVSNRDPKLAADIANTVREEFLTHMNQLNEQKLSRSLTTMENKLLKDEMEALQLANDQLKQQKLQSRSIEFLSTQLSKKNEDLANFQSSLISAEIQRDALRNGIRQCLENLAKTPKTITTVSTAEGIVSLPVESIEITDGKVISENLNEAYIEVQNLYNEKTAALAETEAEIAKTKEKIKQLEEEIRNMEAELINNQIEEKRLQDEVDRREETVKVLNSKISEVKMTEALDLAGHTILTVSPAVTPEHPVKPNKILNIAIAAVLGLMAAIFGVFLVEYMKNGKQQV